MFSKKISRRSFLKVSAVTTAMAAMGVCGELAYEKLRAVDGGSGSYRIFLLDTMSKLDAETLTARARVERL